MPKALTSTPRLQPYMLCVPFGAPKEYVEEALRETVAMMHTPLKPRDIEVRYLQPKAWQNASETFDRIYI